MNISCRFCCYDKLSAGATWCPSCGLRQPVDFGSNNVTLSPKDTVQMETLDFFVCQKCDWPVMPPEKLVTEQDRIKNEVFDSFNRRYSNFHTLIEGWSFILSGYPTNKFQSHVNAKWSEAFRCPNCAHSTFYRQSGQKHNSAFVEALLAIPVWLVAFLLLGYVYGIKASIGSWTVLFSLWTIPIVFFLIVGFVRLMGRLALRKAVDTSFIMAENME